MESNPLFLNVWARARIEDIFLYSVFFISLLFFNYIFF